MALIWSATKLEWYLDEAMFPVFVQFQAFQIELIMRIARKFNRTEQNPRIFDTAISPDGIKLVLFIEPPDWLDLFPDFGGAEFLDRLTDVLVPDEKPGLHHL